MIRLHTIAVIPPVITLTINLETPIHIEMNIQDTLIRGIVAFTTLLWLHLLRHGIRARRVTVVTTLLVVNTMIIA